MQWIAALPNETNMPMTKLMTESSPAIKRCRKNTAKEQEEKRGRYVKGNRRLATKREENEKRGGVKMDNVCVRVYINVDSVASDIVHCIMSCTRFSLSLPYFVLNNKVLFIL